ncbi:MAG TPA: TorF family putative porin [Opitutaceae bacterium]|nr:TorF family putative porin [Opitutaceae bacterium]
MKKTIIILAALAGGLTTLLRAQTPQPPVEEKKLSYSVTVDFPYASKYVFRGLGKTKDTIQPSVEITSNNLYAGVWMNQPFSKKSENEIDFYAGYGIPLDDIWKLDVGGTFYYYPEADRSVAVKHSLEGYIGITGTVAGFTPGVYAYYDVDLKEVIFQGSVGYSIPLKDYGTSLDFTATLGHDSPEVGDDYLYWGVGVNLPFKLTQKATLVLGAQYAANDLDGVDDNHLWFTAGLTVGF